MAPVAQKSSVVAERSVSYFLIKPRESFHKPNNYSCYSFVNVKQCKWETFPSFKLKLKLLSCKELFFEKGTPDGKNIWAIFRTRRSTKK